MTLATAHSRRSDLPTAAWDPHPLVAAVFAALERGGVRWALLRGEARLAAPPHDVDLLVHAGDVGLLARALAPLGFLAVPTWDKGSHRFFVARAPSLGSWVILDVVTELSYGPAYALRSGAAAGCLARREVVGSLALLAPDDAFWTLLLHCILDRGGFPEHQKERLRVLCRSATPESELGGFASRIGPDGWDAERVIRSVGTERWTVLSALRDDLIHMWRRRHPVAFALRRGLAMASRRASPLHTVLRRRGLAAGMLVVDGARARSLATTVARDFYFPARVVGVPGPQSGRVRNAWCAAVRSAAVRYHQGRGRLVLLAYGAIPAPGDNDGVHLPPPRPALLLLLGNCDRSPDVHTASARPLWPLRRERCVEQRVIDVSAESCPCEAVVQALWERYARRDLTDGGLGVPADGAAQ